MQNLTTTWINAGDFDLQLKNITQEYINTPNLIQHIQEYFESSSKKFQSAVDIINQIIKEEKPILVSGDYDVDGMTSTAIVYSTLKKIYPHVSWFVPDRLTDGYGLNIDAVKEKLSSPGLVITVDTGIGEIDNIAQLQSMGHKVIVTDHHLPDTDKLPSADAIINPKLWGEEGTTDYLASGGLVAARTMYFLRKSHGDTSLDHYTLELVSLGILSDVIELNTTMKGILRYGLTLLQDSENMGLRALFNLCRVAEEAPLTPHTLNYNILPKLNAAGRMGQAFKGVELLLTPLCEGDPLSHGAYLATELIELNKTRKSIENAIYIEAFDQAVTYSRTHTHTIIVYQPGWHPGVLGIVAARLMEHFYRPTIVLTKEGEFIKGSCRSIDDFDIYSALKQCGDAVADFGGHATAAGVTLEANGLKKFQDTLEHVIKTIGLPEEKQYTYNAELTFEQCQDIPFLCSFLVKEPIGNKNPEWIFRLEPCEVKFVGNSGPATVIFVKNARDQVFIVKKFRAQTKYETYIGRQVDILVTPMFTYFGGTTQVEWRLVDIKQHKELRHEEDS